ncbi:helicase C-terminal domain-containing protein [Vallicoccus soli]|uniref:DNA-binding protein n=1 Tax=Vallicoccus soli TaxID=2339232 RepID=A0A3A3Z2Z9_9ACTN|nr:helicase C-terminal domain-containing protein [Vallicoccus soli]RJK97794.1 DNA-binding protein [Vallicoccus soli]
MSSPAVDPPRSLSDDLRARDDADLAALLRERPDLLAPVPGDLGQLAARATTQASVARALDRLDRGVLQVAEVLAALPDPATLEQAGAWLGADPRPGVQRLRLLGLLWGPDDALRLVRTVRQVVGSPAGLGPPLREALGTYGPRRTAALLADLGLPATGDPARATERIAPHLSDPAVLDRLLAEVPGAARPVLDRLLWGPAYGRVGDAQRDVTLASASTPVEQLLARGLLVATERDAVVLPREVAVHLRGGHVHARHEAEPPAPEVRELDPALVDRTAGGAASELLRHVEELLEAWSADGPAVLRTGGLGVRDLRRTAAALDVDEQHAAFVAELAYAAGLVGRSTEVDERWWPTPAYDAWLEEPPGARWARLARSWVESTRVAGLVGSRDERDKPRNALSHELTHGAAPEVRAQVLGELAALPPGAAATPASLDERVVWRRPRRAGRVRSDLVAGALREAELLGLTGRGALSGPGRLLVAGDDETAGGALGRLLPEPLDHVLLQADLTAVAPGPLEPALAQEIALLADVESRGGATVYRFSESSVRRALDAGRTADDVHRVLAERSRTPVPQPLTYLVDDVARRHGRIRVGTASAYVRCDDASVLAELAAHRRAGRLRLRRLAPTVLAAQAPVEQVLEELRALGYAPMAETPDGDVLVRRPGVHRTPEVARPPRLRSEPAAPDDRLLTAAVRAVRAGDRAVRAERRPAPAPAALVPRSAVGDTLAALRSAAEEGASLWIGYVNNDGHASERVIDPVRVEGGHVTAFDHLRDEVRTFAVHRITGVAALAD